MTGTFFLNGWRTKRMTITARNLQHAALVAVREEFGIVGKKISLWAGKGIGRILVSAAIAAPDRLLPVVEALEKVYPNLSADFKRRPLTGVSLVGGLIAERPQLMSDFDFKAHWDCFGLRRAIEIAVNPLFRAHIHLLVRVQIAYCEDHHLYCTPVGRVTAGCESEIARRIEAHKRHVNHVRPLRYILHAIPAIKPAGPLRS